MQSSYHVFVPEGTKPVVILATRLHVEVFNIIVGQEDDDQIIILDQPAASAKTCVEQANMRGSQPAKLRIAKLKR
jgi:hypothetical protein